MRPKPPGQLEREATPIGRLELQVDVTCAKGRGERLHFWPGKPLTDRQRDVLEQIGVVPEEVRDRGHAAQIIGEHKRRRARGRRELPEFPGWHGGVR